MKDWKVVLRDGTVYRFHGVSTSDDVDRLRFESGDEVYEFPNDFVAAVESRPTKPHRPDSEARRPRSQSVDRLPPAIDMEADGTSRCGNLEFRPRTGAYEKDDGTGAVVGEIVRWVFSPDRYCLTIAFYIERKEGPDLETIGERPFDGKSVDPEEFMAIASHGFDVLKKPRREWTAVRYGGPNPFAMGK